MLVGKRSHPSCSEKLLPLYFPLPYQAPSHYFSPFQGEDGAILLESTQYDEHLGRYSFIAIDPFLKIHAKNKQVFLNNLLQSKTIFELLKSVSTTYTQKNIEHLPPFQGGIAGYFSYEFAHYIETLPLPKKDNLGFPDVNLGAYDLIISFDHLLKTSWIISTGFPELNPRKRIMRAKLRYKELLLKLKKQAHINQNPLLPTSTITCNFSKKNYLKTIDKTIGYIKNGDIFEANISRRFTTPKPESFSPYSLYLKITKSNPSHFSSFINFGKKQLVSISPERFLSVTNKQVETRPIKGTSPRGQTLQQDREFSNTLISSKKDRAENIMIVDLMRNDLSKVCKDDSIVVAKLCGLESFPSVHHLVSIVQGTLREDCNVVDLLKACFPGGSITGAPKIRAMEIIQELEPTCRGPYCGSIGYLGFNDKSDLSITIRTFCITEESITYQAGGAITLDSHPETEYAETTHKISRLESALTTDVLS